MNVADRFEIGRADLPVSFKRTCAVAQDGLCAGDPGIIVAENARVLLVSGGIRADFAEIQIILRVSGLVKDDTEFAVEAFFDALERFCRFARFFADPGHDAHALRLDEDLAFRAFLTSDGRAERVVGSAEPRAVPACV